MYPFLGDRVPSGIAEEYRWKMKHNFKQYIYLGLKSGRWEQQRVLTEIWRMEGYVTHKIIKYNNIWSHIYIKFENNDLALNAMDYFRHLDCNLNAELVDNLLCSWYIYENITDYVGQGTAAFVDTVGIAPHCMNPMIEPVLAAVLSDFGGSQVLDVRETAAQVMFDSMAEALAACIAHGKWETFEQLYGQFYFRVRIVGANKEAALIGKCLSHDETDPAIQEAFKLDYFVSENSEWDTVEEHCDANVLNNVACYSSTLSLTETPQQGRKIRGRSELSTNQSTFEKTCSHSHIPGHQNSMYATSSPMGATFFNDFGVPLGTIMVNSYAPGLTVGNRNYAPSILHEMRFSSSNSPSNAPSSSEGCIENSRRPAATLFANQYNFSDSFIPKTRELINFEQSSKNSKESSSSHLKTENKSSNQSATSNSLNTDTIKNIQLKEYYKGSSLLPITNYYSSSSIKLKDHDIPQRMENLRLEYRSSKFKNNFSLGKNRKN